MTVHKLTDVEFGAELGPSHPDTRLERSSAFAEAVGWGRPPRFSNHEDARKEGHPGALVPGIMGMGFLTTLIRGWAPDATIEQIDTVFRAPVLVDHPASITAVVTDVDEDDGIVELDLTISNEAGETRVFGTAKVDLPTA